MKEKNKSMKTADRMVQKGMAKAIKLLKMKQGIKIEGEGSICRIGQILSYENRQKPFLVTGSHVSKTDFFLRIKNELKDCVVFDGVHPDPDVKLIEQMVTCYQEKGCDCLVAIGGGSSIDAMKACAARIMCPGKSLSQMKGLLKVRKKLPLMIAIPTTAGTGSECTIATVVCERNHKYAINDPCLCPDYAILDPCLSVSMTQTMSAYSGMDALTHAIEGYITAGAWELSDMFHIKAIEIISRSLRSAVKNEKEGREGMALGEYVAGMGFSNVGLGIDHSMAHTLSAYYNTPHGKACAILLPTVMAFNADASGEKYREIARVMGVDGVDEMNQEEYRKAAIDAVAQLGKDVGIPADLKDIVKEEDIPNLAADAYKDACTPGNPKEVTVEQIEELFRSLI